MRRRGALVPWCPGALVARRRGGEAARRRGGEAARWRGGESGRGETRPDDQSDDRRANVPPHLPVVHTARTRARMSAPVPRLGA
ncbi:hypothetical protein CIK69_13815 [Brachybacterium alimentarium]|nr:hypothetical protein CIK69_13815 [Brachybacterium alimentarium]